MYQIMLFLHILGVILMFVAVGGTLAGMFGMLYAKDVSALKLWSKLATKMDGFLPFSVILILLPALHLVFTTWGWDTAWINVSLVVLLLMTIAGPAINLRRLKGITQAVNNETVAIPSANLIAKVRDRVLWTSVSIMTIIGLGIVYLMVIKPEIIHSLIALAICIIVGWLFANIALAYTKNKNTTTPVK